MLRKGMMGLGLVLALVGAGCDDGDTEASPDSGGAGGSAGEGGAGGGGAGGGAGGEGGTPAPSEGYIVTELDIDVPAAPAGALLKNLLNTSINQERVIIIFRFEEQGGARKILAGAAQYAAGQDTPNDLSDDAFEWLTGGICGDGMGGEVACDAGLSTANVTFTGDTFVSDPTFLDIFSEDLKAVIRIKDANISGELLASGAEATASLQGVITQADALATPFELVPDSGEFTNLDKVLTDFNVTPDAMFDDGSGPVPAYRLEGSLRASVITFAP